MDILTQIVEHRKKQVFKTFSEQELLRIHRTEKHDRKPLRFREALKIPGQINIIAEIKKGSPSKGIIRENFCPEEIAESYRIAGANCFSVLTEEKYFFGSSAYLTKIRQCFAVPALRKDFMVNLRQVRESYEIGADAVLLMVNILKPQELKEFKKLAEEFELDCLTEVHTHDELQIATDCGFNFIGVNNRDLRTFQTSLENSMHLIDKFPAGAIAVSESGIASKEDTQKLYRAGFHAVLVGESFMRRENPGDGITEIRFRENETGR